MRICHLNPFYFPYAGGIERRIRATGRRHAADHDVHILTARLNGSSGGISKEDGVTVHRLESRFPLKRFYNPPPVRTSGLGGALRSVAPDVVDLHFRWSPSYSRAFRDVGDVARVATFHNTWGEGTGALGAMSRLNDRLWRKTLRAADRIVAVSEFIRRDLIDHGISDDAIRVVPNGIDLGEVDAVEGAPAWSPPGPYVVTVGRLVAVKGFDVLVDAAAALPDVHVVIVGQGPLAPSLQRRARRRGVEDRVHLTGWIEEAEKVRLMRSAMAYCQPSRFEAFGMSVLEAMAAGCPALVARVGGLPEVVGEAGRTVAGTAEAWAASIQEVAGDDAARRRMVREGRRRAEGFSWDLVSDGLDAVYREALDG